VRWYSSYHRLALVGCPGIRTRLTVLPSNDLVLFHAHSEVQKRLLERFMIYPVAMATHTLVHHHILIESMHGDGVALVDESVDLRAIVH
jgi:hypothetical protein